MRRAPLLLLPLLSLACQSAPAPRPTPAAPQGPKPDAAAELRSQVGALREQARARLKAESEYLWRVWTGEAVEVTAAPSDPPGLFTSDSVAKVERLASLEQDPERARALRALRLYLATETIARAPAANAASQRLARGWVATTYTLDGQEQLLREVDGRLAAEGHAGRRRAVGAAAGPAFRKLSALALERETQLDQAVRAAGFGGEMELAAQLRGMEPAAMGTLAENLLAATDALWSKASQERARIELGLAPAALQWVDVPRMLRTGEYDPSFPKDRMVPALRESLSAIGLGDGAMLKIDAEPRARKNPRALALPIVVPSDVRLSIKPVDGQGAFAQLLHETGHGLAYSQNRAEGFEFQYLGSNAVNEVWANLFEGLLDQGAFVEGLGLPANKTAPYLRVRALRRLFALRHDAARLLCDLARRPGTGAAGCAAIFNRAYGFALDADSLERELTQSDDFLAGADRLRAAMVATQLEAALAKEFGAAWWREPKAGARLADLMAPGGRQSLEGLLEKMGTGTIDPGPLAAKLAERLGAR